MITAFGSLAQSLSQCCLEAMTDTKDLLHPPERIVLGNETDREWPRTAYVREDLHKDLKTERDTLVSAILDYLNETGGAVRPVWQADGLDKEHGLWPPQEEQVAQTGSEVV